MLTKHIIFFIICTTFAINAAEQSSTDSQPLICYFTLLPVEIHNHIASFLEFHNIESDEEFIARRRASGTISKEHLTLLEEHERNSYLLLNMNSECSSFGTLRTYSVDRSKIISLEMLLDITADKPKVTIFDIHNNTFRTNARLAEMSKKDMHIIKHIALSRNGSHYAQLQKQGTTFKGEKIYQHWIVVKNVLSDESEEQKFLISGYFDNFISIGFNKQGTKIIVHAKEHGLWEDVIPEKEMPENFYAIIELTSLEEHEAKSIKTLEAYFQQIGCCKSLENSLPTT